MKYKVWYIGDGYLLNYVIEPKGETFAEKFNNIILQLHEKITAEGYVERYDIDYIEEANEEEENV